MHGISYDSIDGAWAIKGGSVDHTVQYKMDQCKLEQNRTEQNETKQNYFVYLLI